MPQEIYIGPESLKSALLAALLSVSLLIGVFAYLNHFTKRRYFSLWMVAWLFYALWLMLTYRLTHSPSAFLMMAKTSSVGISAMFLFWGSLIFMGQRVAQRLFGLMFVFLVTWSYVGAYHLEDPLQAKVPIFAMLGIASLVSARCFLVYRLRRTFAGASLLCVGFTMWGAFLLAYPFLEGWRQFAATGFVLAALIQLFIAVSMIILVLEEARTGRAIARDRMAAERAARRGLESRCRSTEVRFRQLFDQARDAIVITDAPGLNIIEINTRAQRLLGLASLPESAVPLSSFLDQVPARASDTQRLDRLLPGAPLNIVSRDGRRTAVSVDRTAIEIDGLPGFQFVLQEMTERTQLEQQVRQAEKLSALGQMISGIAHELNNPLAVVKGHVDLMQARSDVPESLRDDLKKVAMESDRAAKLVRSFLSIAREQPPHRVPLNLNEVIKSVVELRRFDTLVAQADVVLDLDSNLPWIKADMDHVQQVLVNVFTNALHALVGTGGPGKIRIYTGSSEAGITLRFDDSGPGVPIEMRTKIFEPFFTTKETGEGTGLGLSIAHSIISEHGGRIFCGQSSLGGASFVIEFPASAIVAAPPAPVPLPVESMPIRTGKVLVLDDEEALADMVGQMLTFHGHDVIVTSTPSQALDRVKHEQFDAILSDYRMPLMDGRSFYRAVREISPEKAARIIFLTGDVVSDDTRAFFDSIGNPRLSKPFHIDTILRAVSEMMLPRAA